MLQLFFLAGSSDDEEASSGSEDDDDDDDGADDQVEDGTSFLISGKSVVEVCFCVSVLSPFNFQPCRLVRQSKD